MDRIRKALDLAREERSSRGLQALVEEPRSVDARSPKSLPAKIEYTKTRVFTAPAELLESNRITDSAGNSEAAAAFRMLRTQILQRMLEHKWRSLAVLSPAADDGKTTTAINLAISLANDQRHTVLLVDFDFKRPTVADKLGIVPELGADDILRGNAGVEECLYHPAGFDRLVILPARNALEHSSEALAGPVCRELVGELRERYPDRILLFDLPPVMGTDDALAFAPLIECALVVVSEGRTRREDLARCIELLRNTPVIGTVLNCAAEVPATYGHL